MRKIPYIYSAVTSAGDMKLNFRARSTVKLDGRPHLFPPGVPALRNASESSGLDGASNRLAVQAPLERDQQTADI